MDNTTQIYLKVELDSGPVPGEATAGGYEGQIDIDSFGFEATAKKDVLKDVKQGVRSNLDVSRVKISKVFDGASLHLANAMRGRKKFRTATISVDQQFVFDNTEKMANQILIIQLTDGYIAEINLRTSEVGAGAQIKEDIELTFHGIEITYYAEERDEKTRLLTMDWRPKAWQFECHREIQKG